MTTITTCHRFRLALQLRTYLSKQARQHVQPVTISLPTGIDMSMLAPKNKEEYVMAIASRSKLGKEELRRHTLDRLEELWAAVRPKNANTTVLPANWKQLDRAALKTIYQNQVVPDLGRDNDLYWDRSKSTLWLEIEVWAEDASKDLQQDRELETAGRGPLCAECAIPMMVRTNRLTQMPTLPDVQGDASPDLRREANGQLTRCRKRSSRRIRRGRSPRRRRGPRGDPEEACGGPRQGGNLVRWILVATGEEAKYNTYLTKEEMAMIVAVRNKSRRYPRDKKQPPTKDMDPDED